MRRNHLDRVGGAAARGRTRAATTHIRARARVHQRHARAGAHRRFRQRHASCDVRERRLAWKNNTRGVPEYPDQGFYDELDRVYATGEAYRAQEAKIRYRRGADQAEEVRYLTFIYAPVLGEEGEVTGIFCEGFDGTESYVSRIRVDELNRTLEKRVHEAVAERRTAETQLRQSQKMEAIGQLTGRLAHDFNNILADMSGSLELAKARMEQGRLSDVDRELLPMNESAPAFELVV
jgi:signal transduction histidine kinase